MDEIKFIIDENISWRLKRLLPEWNIVPANEIDTAIERLIWKYGVLQGKRIFL